MDVVILSDDQAGAERLRSALAECDVSCPIDRVRPLSSVSSYVNSQAPEVDAIFLMLDESEEGLRLLEELCSRRVAPTVAVGAARDPQFILRVIHAGPSNYLDIEGDLTAELRRALSRLEDTSTTAPNQGHVISILSHSGGSGCSLLASNLAVALAESHGSCLLCDFNVRRGDLATLLNLKPMSSVSDLVRVGPHQHLRRELFEQSLTPHKSKVQLLAAPGTFADVRPVPVETMSQILRLGRSKFPFTVTDLEDFFHAEQTEVMRQSDSVYFVLRLDYTAIRNARRTLDYLEQDGVDESRLRYVVNQYGRPKELTPRQAEDVLGRAIDYYIPYEPKVAIAAMNRGMSILESAPRSKIARAIRKIAEDAAINKANLVVT